MRVVTIVAAVVLALGLAACGGGDDGGETGSAFDTGFFATTEEEAPAETAAQAETTAEPPFQINVPESAPIGPTSPQRAVRQLQRALLLLGFKIGKADGIWGEKTRRAVIRFQRQHNLEADGLVGAQTARAINEELAKLGG